MSHFKNFLQGRCPRCEQGKVLVTTNPYSLRDMITVHKKCPVCGLNFIPEPGFYWGATYTSYMLTVAFSVLTFGISTAIFGFMNSLNLTYVLVNGILLVLLSPIFVRFSRIMWLWMFYERN